MSQEGTNMKTIKITRFAWAILVFFVSGAIFYEATLTSSAYASAISNPAENSDMATNQLLNLTSYSNIEEVARLIEEGADVNSADRYAMTPLMWAAMKGNPAVVRSLIEKGANVNAVDKGGKTPLFHAARYNRNPDVIRILIENSSDVNAIDMDCMSPLMYAARNNDNPEVLKILIEKGADVNATDKDGRTPLMNVAQYGSTAATRLLIEKGADAAIIDNNGTIALDYVRSSDPFDKYTLIWKNTPFLLWLISSIKSFLFGPLIYYFMFLMAGFFLSFIIYNTTDKNVLTYFLEYLKHEKRIIIIAIMTLPFFPRHIQYIAIMFIGSSHIPVGPPFDTDKTELLASTLLLILLFLCLCTYFLFLKLLA